MLMSATKISDLANYLGVSKSTVSRALQDSHEISIETKQKILQVASELNYQPNPYASSLKKHVSKTIAVVVPQFDNNYFVDVIKGIQSVAHPNEYHVLLYFTYENPEEELTVFKHLITGRVDGIIVSTVNEDGNNSHIVDFIDSGVPVLFFDRILQNVKGTKVTTNNAEITFNATELLISKGCRKLCYVNSFEHLSVGKKRLEGFLSAIDRNKTIIEKYEIIDFKSNSIEYLNKSLHSKNKPDGIVSSDEDAVTTIYRICKKLKIKIPEDIKIVSFSNLAFADLLSPSLSTIEVPAFKMGETAAQLLIKSLTNKKNKLIDEEFIINSKIIERSSTDTNNSISPVTGGL